VQEWIAVVGAKNAYIERGSPWKNAPLAGLRRSAAILRKLLANTKTMEIQNPQTLSWKTLASPKAVPAGTDVRTLKDAYAASALGAARNDHRSCRIKATPP
jgi:hypothetical protein